MEGENKVPTGKELIRPTAGFVVKTHKGPGSKKASGNGDGEGEKMFLNIVQSDKINNPSSTTSGKGMHWSVPYSVGPVHMEIDKSGELNVACFDICFHPEALGIAIKSKQFKETAIDGVELSYKQNLPLSTTVLNRDKYHILKGVLYKSGDTIPTMMVDSSSKEEQWKSGKIPMPMPSSTPSAASSSKTIVPPVPPAIVKPPPAAQTGTNVVTNPKPITTPTPTTKPAIQKGFLNRASKKLQEMPLISGNKNKNTSSGSSGSGSGSSSILTHEAPTDSDSLSSGMSMSMNTNPYTPSSTTAATGGGGLVQDVTGQVQAPKPTTNTNSTTSTTSNNDIGLSAGTTTIRKRTQPTNTTTNTTTSNTTNTNTTTSTSSDKCPHYVLSERGSQQHATQSFESIDKQFVASNRYVGICVCV